MPTFQVHVRKTGNEMHSVEADTFADALKAYTDGAAAMKGDETSEVHRIRVVNTATGKAMDEEEILGAKDEEPRPRSYGVRLWGTFRGSCNTEVEATSFEEAVKNAEELKHSEFIFTFEYDCEGDETLTVYGPDDDDPDDDDPWKDDGTGGGFEVDKRKAGEPYSWEACELVKDMAKLADISNDTFTTEQVRKLIARAKELCTTAADKR